MPRMTAFWLLGCFLGIAFPAASARMQSLGQDGAWESFTGFSDKGLPLCGMGATAGPDRGLHIKHYLGDAGLVLHLFREGWAWPAGRKLRVGLRFDQEALLPKDATGHGDLAEIHVVAEAEIAGLFAALHRGQRLEVLLPEENWTISLSGARMAAEKMSRCIRLLPPPEPAPRRS
ncbi:hypothetical protein NON00_15250 [Roseomonas sp. GC11]|uniref:hypothetical protein n=1 Tax=Roseomonas sp. GC11 TaxID=2950546 RepID=UPI00210CC120|nr:hypothetical protein [Roseomonas sp. GC11]MCQ4161276.1 hypothetical protein [Roseomonas sp. GC11]